MQAAKNCKSTNIHSFSPLCDSLGRSVNSNAMVVSAVIVLGRPVCPANIARFVIAVVIYAVNAMVWGRLISNIAIKRLKRIYPFFADLYATTSVVFKAFIGWAITSVFHVLPCFVFRRFGHAMSSHSFNGNFFTKASATLHFFGSKAIGSNRNYVSARTAALPSCVFTVFNLFKNCQAAKTLAGKINKWWHNKISWLRFLVKEMKRQAKYQWLSFSGMTLSANNNINLLRGCQ